jgi:hypothetical protein
VWQSGEWRLGYQRVHRDRRGRRWEQTDRDRDRAGWRTGDQHRSAFLSVKSESAVENAAYLHLENPPPPCYKSYVSSAEKYRNNATTTAALMEAGINLMRENLRRRNPAATDAKIDTLLGSWLCRKNDPIPGDTAGSIRIRNQ